LIKNIESKAKKNEERDEIQFLFVKPKKTFYQPKEDNEKILSLTKKLNSIEDKLPEEKKQQSYNTTFFRTVFNRTTHKADTDLKLAFSEGKLNKNTPKNSKNSFEQYYK
jgi:hypothetical protein